MMILCFNNGKARIHRKILQKSNWVLTNIYPEIVYRNGTEKYNNGEPIQKGYYYRAKNLDGGFTLTSLGNWLNK